MEENIFSSMASLSSQCQNDYTLLRSIQPANASAVQIAVAVAVVSDPACSRSKLEHRLLLYVSAPSIATTTSSVFTSLYH